MQDGAESQSDAELGDTDTHLSKSGSPGLGHDDDGLVRALLGAKTLPSPTAAKPSSSQVVKKPSRELTEKPVLKKEAGEVDAEESARKGKGNGSSKKKAKRDRVGAVAERTKLKTVRRLPLRS